MQSVWAVSLQALQNDGSQVDRIASNLVNASTVGYRREVAVQRPFSEMTHQLLGAMQAGTEQPASTPSVARDPRAGTLRSTGRSLDVALTTPGYFEVLTSDGPAYTRQGQFAVDEQGRLVMEASRHPVVGTGGEIQLSPGAVAIDANGRISQDGSVVGQLKVVTAEDGASVQSAGQGLCLLGGQPHPVAQDQVQVKQGFVENSNVDTAHEMVQLMTHMRHFESMYRMAQAYDDMLGTAVKKLGDL